MERRNVLLRSLLLLLMPVSCNLFRINKDANSQWPAFCSRILPSTADVWRREASSSTSQKSKMITMKLDHGETACIQSGIAEFQNHTFGDNQTVSIFHVFRYSDFHQEHPIAHRYTFGIPQLWTNCTCDCPGGNRICFTESKYKTCDANPRSGRPAAICRKTYHSGQNAIGCSNTEDPASLCCEVYAGAYKNQKFTALDLSRPTTFGKLSYEVYDGRNGHWTKITNEDFVVSGRNMTVQ